MGREKRTYADRASYMVQAVAKRRKKIRQMAVEYKGGRCQICDYDKWFGSLDLHHRDASQKEFGISETGNTRSWDRVRQEADKCVLLCANCHREVHAGITQLPMETSVEK